MKLVIRNFAMLLMECVGILVNFEGLPGLGGLEEVIVSLNSGEARISGGWGG